ncbi:CBS domain-containing protein [Candidatus Woesearchaeota archaeon]|nr:MAG: CBS domain-containing protein [Candidatus Woesearchaeota archaeon]
MSMDKQLDIFSIHDDLSSVYEVPVEAVMTVTVETLKPEDTLDKAIDKMLSNDISGLVIVNDKEEPVGMLTKRDLLEQVLLEEKHKDNVSVIISSRKGLVDKQVIEEEIKKFIERHEREIGEGTIHAYIASISNRPHPLLQCRLRLLTSKMRVRATGESRSELEAVQKALDTLKETFRKEKGK